MSARGRTWLAAWAPLLLVGVVPALLLSVGVAQFILNHFFAHPPYLLDSGLLSGLTYRSGPMLTPPEIACAYATSFYQVYFSPIISVFVGLSYLLPVDRIEWFAFVEALVFLPIAVAVYPIARRLDPAGALRRLPITIFAAIAFAFSGLVLRMIEYPHYEAATSGLVCLMLAAVVTGRTRTAWVFLAIAASVRQDGGFHAALALTPLIYLQWRKVEMSPSRRSVLVLFAGAIGMSVLGFAAQRLLVVPVDRLRPIYLGTPAYAHLTWSLLARRALNFLATCQLIYYPLLATVLIAALRRDARYLLGWAAAVPWFLFNFAAVDDQKASFAAYTVGPFLVSMLWVYVYGAFLAPAARRLRPGVLEAAFTLICLSSTLGSYRLNPGGVSATLSDMLHMRHRHRDEVHRFAQGLGVHRVELGRLRVDYAVAAVALEWLVLGDTWQPSNPPVDTLAFHISAVGADETMVPSLVENRLDLCTRMGKTGFYVCTRDRLPARTFDDLSTQTMPSVLVFSRFYGNARPDERGLTLLGGRSIDGSLGPLPRGAYRWTLAFESAAPHGTGDLLLLEILRGDVVVGSTSAPSGAATLALRFDADGVTPLTYRIRSAATRR